MFQARMQKIYKQGIAMDTTSDVKTELEELCEGNLKVAEQELVKQQDIVLKHQTEFKIALETYNRDVKFLNEEFDQFCREKFGTLLPELNNISPVTVSIKAKTKFLQLHNIPCRKKKQDQVLQRHK